MPKRRQIELEVDQGISFTCPAMLGVQLELRRLIECLLELVEMLDSIERFVQSAHRTAEV